MEVVERVVEMFAVVGQWAVEDAPADAAHVAFEALVRVLRPRDMPTLAWDRDAYA